MNDHRNPSQPTLNRMTRACDQCSQARIRCNGRQPCARCNEYLYQCSFERPIRSRGRKARTRNHLPNTPIRASSRAISSATTEDAPIPQQQRWARQSFKSVGDDANSLRTVQCVYLAIACFVFILAGIFYFSPLPKVTNADMQMQVEETQPGRENHPLSKEYRLFHASMAQFCYNGSQVAIAGFFINYVVETRPGTDSSVGAQLLAGAQGAFAVGQFLGVVLMEYLTPRKVFLWYFSIVIVFTAVAIPARMNAAIAALYIVLFFESVIFPTVVALGMRGLGKNTKRGSGFIISGVAGGAVVTPILGVVSDRKGTATAMAVPLSFFLVGYSFPVCCNFLKFYRDAIDTSGGPEANPGRNDADTLPVSRTREDLGIMRKG